MGNKGQKKGEKFAKEEQCAATRLSAAGGTSSVSPIHTLVSDVLVAIFAQALHEQVEVDYRSSWNRMVPMNVSAVCHQWRDIVLASPLLWSSIKGFEGVCQPQAPAFPWQAFGVLAREFPISPDPEYPWKQFNLFLRRSGQAPLDISIELRGAFQDPALLASALNDNQTRLRSVSVHLLDDHRSNRGLRTEWTLPNLSTIEDLHLKWDRDVMITLKMKYAPFLRCLRLEGGISLGLDTDLSLPNLVKVELSNADMLLSFGVHDCIMFLQASPSIKEFSACRVENIVDKYHLRIPKVNGISICLRKLSVFTLTETNPETVQLILDALILSGLTKLVIDVNEGSGSSTCGVHSFLKRSNPVLETLDLCIPDILEFTQCLKLQLDLQILYLSENLWRLIGTYDLFEYLTLNPEVQMCPRLKKIVFGKRSLSDIEDEVVEMIYSWWSRSKLEGGNHLEAVEFRNCSGERTVSLKLEERCKGLDIVVNNDLEDDVDVGYDTDSYHEDYGSDGEVYYDSDYNHDAWGLSAVSDMDSDYNYFSDFSN